MTFVRRESFLGRSRMLDFLGEVGAKTGEAARTFYFPGGTAQPEIERALQTAVDEAILPDIAGLTGKSSTGAGLFWGPELKCLVIPPFPVSGGMFTGYEAGPLLEMLHSRFTVALVLVRLGAYAIGVCKGESLEKSKVGTGLVHGRHRKGGSSQKRFQRHREKQIESFLIRVCGHIREHLEPEAGSIDYLVYGGARTTVLSLQKHCDFLERLKGRSLPRLLDVPAPRRETLESAVRRVWSSTAVTWEEG